MSSERYRWMLVDDFVDHINAYRSATFSAGMPIGVRQEAARRCSPIASSFIGGGSPSPGVRGSRTWPVVQRLHSPDMQPSGSRREQRRAGSDPH